MSKESIDRIGVLSSLSHHCAARIDSLSVHLSDSDIQHVDSFIQGCENLDHGEIDLFVAPSNLVWDDREILAKKGLSIVAALQRNHPFHVLVSSDDPWHLKADAIILCGEKIIQRQLLRRRGKIPRRLDIRNYSEFDLDSNSGEDLRKAQQMINDDKIDGFVIPRGCYSLAGLNQRRHAMLPDAEEMAGMRFIPAPFVDLMLVVARQGFHPHIIQSWTDNEAKNAWLVTKTILERTPIELHDRIGIHYRQRNVGPILEEAERVKDLFVLETLHDPEGEVDDLLRYEIIVETINEDGTMTTGIERVGPVDKLYVDIHFMMNDWNAILERIPRLKEDR
ncbi:MAG: hypothetical protein VXW30_04930 [Candidatus Thermoplasmatota archaeon]|nr:hypothetical protein [Candidatus Thermoplasmatota archaeon]